MAAFGEAAEEETSEETLLCTFACTGENPHYQAIYVCKTCAAAKARGGKKSAVEECCCEGCSRSCHEGHDVKFIAYGPSYCDCGKRGPSACGLVAVSEAEAGKLLPSLHSKAGPALPMTLPASYVTADSLCQVHHIEYAETTTKGLKAECAELVKHSKETFWLGHEDKPRCALEQLAKEIYMYHVQDFMKQHNNAALSPPVGAEWWVQVKNSGADISLHYDKDEKIAEVFQLGFFPLISTVTYLTEESTVTTSLPTVIFNTTAKAPIGESPIFDVAVSYPQFGKHISFKGDLLHGAPKQWVLGDDDDDEAVVEEVAAGGKKKEEEVKASAIAGASSSDGEGGDGNLRVTFLMNVWAEHRPADVSPLPDSILPFLTPSTPSPVCTSISAAPEGALAHLHVTLEDAKGNTNMVGEFVIIPFISSKSAWGKDEDEQGLSCVAWVPEQTQSASSSGVSTTHICYKHEDCAPALMYEDDDEEWEDDDDDEEEGEEEEV